MPLTLTALSDVPLVKPGDDLEEVVTHALLASYVTLEDGDIIILAQKIVSKAEGRLVNLATVAPSSKAKQIADQAEKDPRLVEIILQESNEVLRVRPGLIIVEHRLGFVCANAGIDRSNVPPETDFGDWVLLLPEDPDASAARLRSRLEATSGVQMGVLIIDSHGRSWRLGTVGLTIGISGLPGRVDLRGKPDLFGYKLHVTEVGAADELAAGASLMMGQAAEGTPIVHARGFPYPLRESSLGEIIRPKDLDLFR
jgi:coenzyme F420-0:L-glutamate ligase/coenzyme F420-1:gamma-L-glutamate ligase